MLYIAHAACRKRRVSAKTEPSISTTYHSSYWDRLEICINLSTRFLQNKDSFFFTVSAVIYRARKAQQRPKQGRCNRRLRPPTQGKSELALRPPRLKVLLIDFSNKLGFHWIRNKKCRTPNIVFMGSVKCSKLPLESCQRAVPLESKLGATVLISAEYELCCCCCCRKTEANKFGCQSSAGSHS